MSSGDLTLFSYEILGLVGRTGAAPHDLLRLARRDRLFAWAGESQYYVEPKRLARLGYLDARKEPGRTRQRTVYTLTDEGLDALRDYARTPVRLTPLKSEALVRLLIADLVGEAPTRQGLTTLRDDVEDVRARLDETRATAHTLPHRRKYLTLVNDFAHRLLELHLELVEAVERELDPASDDRPAARRTTRCARAGWGSWTASASTARAWTGRSGRGRRTAASG
jgi:DNA-binding PadR family transcriptional regulator